METMTVNNDRYRLGYHVMAKAGWINDPNGFSYFKGYYHIFYQYYPYGSDWGPMHWGHARSKDLVHWETLPIDLEPTIEDGCFSGSAVEYDGKLWLIYTGHHYTDPNDQEQFYEDQNLAYSTDGIHFTKYEGNPVLTTPSGNTKHFRDPKVWQDGDTFYMVLGSQGEDGLGRALLYQSHNLIDWKELPILDKASNLEDEGYMWECPDFFRLNGEDILLMSPQGLEPKGDKYRNLNQTGYLMGQLKEDFTLSRSSFIEIDNGHDFYATQTLLTPDGRRVMIAWMNAWDSPMYEKADGWAGALTLPRELVIRHGKIYQLPIKELKSLREACEFSGTLEAHSKYELARTSEFEMAIKGVTSGKLLTLSDGDNQLDLTVDLSGQRLILNRSTTDGERVAHLDLTDEMTLQVYIDKSSVEIFVNEGSVTFTERIYWNHAIELSLDQACDNQTHIYRLEEEANTY